MKDTSWAEINEILNTKCLDHFHYVRAKREFQTHLEFAAPGEILVLTGVSGAGKTRIVHEVMDQYNRVCSAGSVPAIYALAPNTSVRGQYDAKEMTRRLLRAVKAPDVLGPDGETIPERFSVKLNRLSNSQLQAKLACNMKSRNTRFVMVDEAQNVQYSGKSITATDPIMDQWKRFSDETGTVLVLSASYKVLEVISRSGHLSRRSRYVHLHYYRDTKEDLDEFHRIVSAYGQLIPGINDLNHNGELTVFLRKKTLGSVGKLINILRRCIVYCVSRRLSFISAEAINSALRPDGELAALLEEAEIGNRFFNMQREFSPDVRGPNNKVPKSKPFQRKPRRIDALSEEGKRGGVS